jgi:hypothetical protein
MGMLSHAAPAGTKSCFVPMSYGELTIFNCMNDFRMRDKCAFVYKGVLDRIFACARYVCKIETLSRRGNFNPLNLLRSKRTELGPKCFDDPSLVRQVVLNHVVETAEKCTVEYANMIGCSDY